MDKRYNDYIANIDKVSEKMTVRITPEMSDSEIIAFIRQNASELFELHCENDRLLDELLFSKTPGDLTDEEIADLCKFSDVLITEDVAICFKVNELLYDAAKLRGDKDLLIRALYYKGLSMHYLRLTKSSGSVELFGDRCAEYFGEGASYYKDYDEFKSGDTRSYIIRCHANRRLCPEHFNLIGEPLGDDKSFAIYKNFRQMVRETLDIVRSEEKRSENPEIPWKRFERVTMEAMTSRVSFLRESTFTDEEYKEAAEEIFESAEYVYNDDVDIFKKTGRPVAPISKYRYWSALYHLGKLTPEELLEKFEELYLSARHDDFTSQGIFCNLRIPLYMNSYGQYLSDEGQSRFEETMERAKNATADYLSRMPRNQYVGEMAGDLRVAVWYRSGQRSTYRGEVLEYILACHPPTYIHSHMVAWLCETIFLRIAETDPESLIGVFGIECCESISAGKFRLAKAIRQCGLYHDLGKCMIINHIGNYSRRLTDEEFAVIKAHPRLGADLLKKLDANEDCIQAALQHHRNYDCSGGYPNDSGPIPRRSKKIVDILSVADSLEAGTDDVGRCYAAKKTVDDLVGELKRFSGTRYAPYVVKIFEDEEFCNKLKSDMIRQRRKIYCETYTELCLSEQ